MTETDNLSKFGITFQIKAISCLLSDKAFMDQMQDVVDESHFESESHSWIVNRIVWYFNKYRTLPSMDVFKSEIDKAGFDGTMRTKVVTSLREVYKNASSEDIDYIKKEYLAFCKNQVLKSAILRSADLLPAGDYDGIKALIDKAVQAGQERDYGHDWKVDCDARFLEEARDTVGTGWNVINQITDGGLGGGELGVVVAPPGVGKTWALCNIGAAAMKKGLNVLQYSLELNQKYVGFRYDTTFTGIEPSQIRHNVGTVKENVEKVPGNLIIKFYPPRTATTSTVRAHLNRLDRHGFKPDLILIDYGDLMRPTEKGEARYQDLAIVYEDIRGLAGELDVPIWTASQSGRSSMDDDIIEGKKIAESFDKLKIADFIMSISRKQEDKANDTGRVYIIKNRFGRDGDTFPAAINFLKGTFDVYHPNSAQGQSLNSKMKSSDDVLSDLLGKSDFKFGNTGNLD